MTVSIWDKDVLLDIAVNIVPLIIMLFFLVAFIVVNPWPTDSLLGRVLQFALLVIPIVGLAHLTYMAAKYIEGTHSEHEA